MRLLVRKEEVDSAIFGDDGKTVASASADGTIKIWSLDGEELASLVGHGDRVGVILCLFVGVSGGDRVIMNL